MPYIYKINTNDKNTEIRFISPKEYDTSDIYEINGKTIDLFKIDGTKIVVGWIKDVPVSITLDEDKNIGYLNVNEEETTFEKNSGILYLDNLDDYKNVTISKKDGKYYIKI